MLILMLGNLTKRGKNMMHSFHFNKALALKGRTIHYHWTGAGKHNNSMHHEYRIVWTKR